HHRLIDLALDKVVEAVEHLLREVAVLDQRPGAWERHDRIGDGGHAGEKKDDAAGTHQIHPPYDFRVSSSPRSVLRGTGPTRRRSRGSRPGWGGGRRTSRAGGGNGRRAGCPSPRLGRPGRTA